MTLDFYKLNFSQDEFLQKKSEFGGTVLYKKIPTDTHTVIGSYLKIAKKFPHYNFLLESAENSANKGRFSVIGINPDKIWKCQNSTSYINNDFVATPKNFVKESGDPLKNFRQFVKDCQINWSHLHYGNSSLPNICAGVFGYMGYDMVRLMENLPNKNLNDDINIADSIFIRPQILVIFDNLFDCALICAPLYSQSLESYESLARKITEIDEILQENLVIDNHENLDFDKNFVSNFTQQQYCQIVEKSKEYIRAGDIFQILPSQRFIANFPKNLDPFYFYRSLRAINPSPFLFYLKFEDFVLTGSSPEIMVALKNKNITIRPLAGTRKRGKDEEQDKIIAQQLLTDEKEVAEHLMLIDLGRHDVGSIAKTNSVNVTKKMVVEYYSHVMHLSSTVEGIIKDECDAIDALIAGFPAGTVSGAPKIRAMEIIEELENCRRSFYAGCVGYFASNSDMETCITLRSALIKNDKIYLQSGAGVVFDSVPESEYQECVNKAQALVKAYHNIKSLFRKD